MTKRLRIYLLLVGFVCLLTGCAEALVISAVMPPKATYETVIDRNNHKISNTSPQVRLLLFEDKRESLRLIRSTIGYQGILYEGLGGWHIDSARPINELITEKIGAHLETCGISIVTGDNKKMPIQVLGGEIITFNLDKKKPGGFSKEWIANVDLNIFLKDTTENNGIKYYRVTGTAARVNWRGANSGVDALNEALDIAINKLDIKSIQSTLAQKQ